MSKPQDVQLSREAVTAVSGIFRIFQFAPTYKPVPSLPWEARQSTHSTYKYSVMFRSLNMEVATTSSVWFWRTAQWWASLLLWWPWGIDVHFSLYSARPVVYCSDAQQCPSTLKKKGTPLFPLPFLLGPQDPYQYHLCKCSHIFRPCYRNKLLSYFCS